MVRMDTQKKNFFRERFLMRSIALAGALLLPSSGFALPDEEASNEDLQEIEEFGELNDVIQAVASANTAAVVTRAGIGSAEQQVVNSGEANTQAASAPPDALSGAVFGGESGLAAPVNTVQPVSAVSIVPVKAIYVYENQPVQIVDSQGRLIQVIYLVRKK